MPNFYATNLGQGATDSAAPASTAAVKTTNATDATADITAAATDLHTLINTLCPDGVEWKTIGEVAKITRGKVISKPFIQNNPGKYPVYSSQTENDGCMGYIDSYMFDGDYVTWTTDGANAGTVFHRTGKFNTTNVCGLLEPNQHMISPKYLSYILGIKAKTYVSKGMGNPKLMSNTMSKVRIPVPPLAVQEKIVQILDKFTELAKELAKENQARRTQYEYYRDWLLDLAHPEGKQGKVWDLLRTLCPDGVEWKTVGELQKADIMHTLTPSFKLKKDAYQEQGTTPIVSQDKELITGYCDTVDPKIPDGEYVCFGDHTERIKYLGTRFVQGADGLKIMSTNEATLLPKYYYYAIMSHYVCIGKYERHFKRLLETRIPVPPLPVQAEIVRILDQFSTLAEDITAGLPAEIAARQAQYEYYRNQLLSFKER